MNLKKSFCREKRNGRAQAAARKRSSMRGESNLLTFRCRYDQLELSTRLKTKRDGRRERGRLPRSGRSLVERSGQRGGITGVDWDYSEFLQLRPEKKKGRGRRERNVTRVAGRKNGGHCYPRANRW